MTQRVRVAGLVLAIVLTSCTGPHRVTLGGASHTHRGRTTPPIARPGAPRPQPAPAPTTAAVTGSDPSAVAARFTMAYFTAAPGDAAGARRLRCRPLDTDALDLLLRAPSWNGAANHPEADQTVTATIDALTPVESTPQGIGYELTVTVIASLAGPVLSSDQVGVPLWVVSAPRVPGGSARCR